MVSLKIESKYYESSVQFCVYIFMRAWNGVHVFISKTVLFIILQVENERDSNAHMYALCMYGIRTYVFKTELRECAIARDFERVCLINKKSRVTDLDMINKCWMGMKGEKNLFILFLCFMRCRGVCHFSWYFVFHLHWLFILFNHSFDINLYFNIHVIFYNLNLFL